MHIQNFYKPHPLLQNHVRYYWTLDFANKASEEFNIKLMADRFPRLTLQLTETGAVKMKGDKIPIGTITGANIIPIDFSVSNRYSQFAVSFHPHALKSIFEIDAYEVTNELPDLNNFLKSEVGYLLQEAPDNEARVSIMDNALIARLQKSKFAEVDPILQDFISNSIFYEGYRAADLMKKYHVSDRSIQRKFRSWIGLSPKKYLQICRFEKAYNNLNKGNYNKLSDIVYSCGYADQSHFIREFRNYSGLSPLIYLKGNIYGSESNGILTDKSK